MISFIFVLVFEGSEEVKAENTGTTPTFDRRSNPDETRKEEKDPEPRASTNSLHAQLHRHVCEIAQDIYLLLLFGPAEKAYCKQSKKIIPSSLNVIEHNLPNLLQDAMRGEGGGAIEEKESS